MRFFRVYSISEMVKCLVWESYPLLGEDTRISGASKMQDIQKTRKSCQKEAVFYFTPILATTGRWRVSGRETKGDNHRLGAQFRKVSIDVTASFRVVFVVTRFSITYNLLIKMLRRGGVWVVNIRSTGRLGDITGLGPDHPNTASIAIK